MSTSGSKRGSYPSYYGGSNRGSYPSTTQQVCVDPSGVNLDVSRMSYLSHGSQGSADSVKLGGSNYPVGSTVGTSGLFVIGDPSHGSNRTSGSNQSISTTYSVRRLIDSKGYVFEDWNWPVIRFCCLLFVVAIMVGLLAATIGLVMETQKDCILDLEWWQGGVIYRIKVNEFYDKFRKDGVGDLDGLRERIDYLEFLGISVITLSNFLPSLKPYFDEVMKFDDVDDRMGSSVDLQNLVNYLQSKGIKVILEMDFSHTSEAHEWFEESRRQFATADNFHTNFYVWKDKVNFLSANYSWLSCSNGII